LYRLPNAHNKTLDKIVKHLRQRWLLQKLTYTVLIGMCVGLATYWLTEWVVWPVTAIALMIILAGMMFSRSKQYQNITVNKVLLHLNREFKECEESAELILLPSDALSTLQQLQKTRIQPQLDQLFATDLSSHLPRYSSKPAIELGILILLIFTFLKIIPPNALFKTEPANTQAVNEVPKPSKLIRLESKSMTVIAPSYTGLTTRQTTDLNLELIAGSSVTWRLQIAAVEPQNHLSIMLPGKQQITLIRQTDNVYLATVMLNQSGVYYLTVDRKTLGDIHTIAVTEDARPTIRFVAPTQTITELAKNSEPKVQVIVSIEDDFGLGRVEILASIASGSGEAVKFRDQTFQFDSEIVIEGKTHFLKNWDLAELAMQPGDELYFSIRAWDNRLPVAQQSRSASKIIRWLEGEQQGILANAIGMDFMPEYFKSQRQIIIETKQLIADKTILSIDVFNRTSRDLGSAQDFLKQKYGQFLGDEFDSGTLQSMEAGPELEHDGHDEHSDGSATTAEHEHDDQEHQTEEADKSGYRQVIEQFGHAHGEADDGNFVKKGLPSPKLLMKRAMAKMWQAELHLRLSEPELALPFENQALALLNRAKQADRIYVKRLGFEPPPVSEKRRYQGDLSDILSYQRNEKTAINITPMSAIVDLVNILNNNFEQLSGSVLTDTQMDILEKVKAYFLAQLSASPKDITFIATLQRIQQSGSFTLNNCKDCISALKKKLWQTLPPTIAAPTTKKTPYSLHNNMLQKYHLFLQQQNKELQP
jgi:hypothetical protein